MNLCKGAMIDSYRSISFYGERRGAQDFEYYNDLLSSDLLELGENQGNYREKFISKIMTAYHRQANCTSAFIVGPAKYNVRRHEKVWASRDKAFSDFDYWRSKYFKAVNRVRTPSPEQEIESAVNDIDKLLRFQAVMKETNKLIRKHKIKIGEKPSKEGIDALIELYSYDENPTSRVASVLEPDCFNGIGYQSFELTSINNKIKARRDKITIMKRRIEVKESFEPINFDGGSIYIENDRVIIFHDSKPPREIIQAIKSSGFRWSPKMGNWCRKHTANARRDADYLLNNHFGGKQ